MCYKKILYIIVGLAFLFSCKSKEKIVREGQAFEPGVFSVNFINEDASSPVIGYTRTLELNADSTFVLNYNFRHRVHATRQTERGRWEQISPDSLLLESEAGSRRQGRQHNLTILNKDRLKFSTGDAPDEYDILSRTK